MSGTTNNIRIKTWPDSPGSSAATNMTLQNILMENASNPIIIDQSYCPFSSCSFKELSQVKLSDILYEDKRDIIFKGGGGASVAKASGARMCFLKTFTWCPPLEESSHLHL